MTRNASGVDSLPNTIASGDAVAAAPVQANFASLSAEITASLPRAGTAAMTAPLPLASGSVSAPGLTFSSDTNTGLYRVGSDDVGLSAGGAKVGGYDAEGLYDINAVRIVGLPTGFGPVPWSVATAPTGWVRCNGRTIGNASSNATERANADTADLFAHLWDGHANTVLAIYDSAGVASTRGASAAADYAANKALALFDIRSAAIVGTDDMGNSAAGRLGTIHTTPTTIGTAAGTETVTLVEANLASHTHTGPSHTHSVSITSGNENANHEHAISITSGAGSAHAHLISVSTATDTSTSGGGTRVTAVTLGAGTSTTSESSHTHLVSGTSGSQNANHQHLVSGTTAAGGTGATGSTGSGTAHSNLQRSIVFPFIIKL